MDVVETRRKRLRHLIDTRYGGQLVQFVQRTKVSPSELSGLLRNKSFGEKRARALEVQAGLPPMYLDLQDDTQLLLQQIMEIIYNLSEDDQKKVLAFCELFKKKEVEADQRCRRRRMQNIPVEEDKRIAQRRQKDEENNNLSSHH